jgi:8-oxo-dGTP pyrophosphatase MutT (NUDIX family)
VSSYEDFQKARPLVGRNEFGEVEAVPSGRANPRWGPFGLVFQSPYLSVTREQVRFPAGNEGTHLRLFQGSPGQEIFGAVVLPIRPRPGQEPEIACVRQWRYPRQGWMTEIPRGGLGSRENTPTGAIRELREETGLPHPDILVHMDDMVNDSGMCATVCRHYLAVYMGEHQGGPAVGDNREAISNVLWLPASEWRAAAKLPPFPGRPVGGLDSFTAAAYGLAHLSGSFVRMEIASNAIFEGRLRDAQKLSGALHDAIDPSRLSYDVVVKVRDAASAQALKSELPLLDFRADPSNGAEIRAYDSSALTISWLSRDHRVVSICLMEERQ